MENVIYGDAETQKRLNNARNAVLFGEKSENGGIGTLGEKSLHAILKYYFEPDCARHEVRVGKYVADIAGSDGITEIQTRNYSALRGKLTEFLANGRVTLVCPVPHIKKLGWINPGTGEIGGLRKSPKTGRPYDVLFELVKLRGFLTSPNLTVRIVMLDITEFRFLDGWDKEKKRGSTRAERIPDAFVCSYDLKRKSDYGIFLPDRLPREFTLKEYGNAAKLTPKTASAGLYVLKAVGAVGMTGKRGKAYLYGVTI